MRQLTIIMDETQAEDLEQHAVSMPAQVIWHAPEENERETEEEAPDETTKERFGNPQGDSLPFQKAKKQPSVRAYQKITEFRGNDSLRKLCEKLLAIAPHLQEETYADILDDTAYLFSVESCIGINARISLFFDFLNEEGLLSNEGGGMEIHLQYGKGPGISIATFKQLVSTGQGSMYSIDISSWIDHLEEAEFRDFLHFLYGMKQDLRYVFRIPYVESRIIQHVSDVLSDVFTIETILLPPMAQPELEENASILLKNAGFSLSEDAWDVFRERITEEKADSRFYGMNTIQKIVHEIILLMLQKCSALPAPSENTSPVSETQTAPPPSPEEIISPPLRTVTGADICDLLQEKSNLIDDDPDIALREMIGIDDVRDELQNVITKIRNSGFKTPQGIFFIGNPGTGRTAIARILSELLRKNEYIRKGFFEYTLNELTGDVTGETIPKTMTAMRDADHAVLFIDEVEYKETIEKTDPDPEEENDGETTSEMTCHFQKEALETLRAEAELHPNTLVIIAGTEKEIETLTEKFPSLSEAFPHRLHFRDFTRDELFRIFMHMASKEQYRLTKEAEDHILHYFTELPLETIQQSDFSNARYVRNLYERTKSKLELRNELLRQRSREITTADFRLAASESNENLNRKEIKKYPLGFRLEP